MPKTAKAYSYDNGEKCIECCECGRKFSSRSQKMTERFFKLHIEKTHGVLYAANEDIPATIDAELARRGLNKDLVREIRK